MPGGLIFADAYAGIPLTPTLQRSCGRRRCGLAAPTPPPRGPRPRSSGVLTGKALCATAFITSGLPRVGGPALPARLLAAGYRVPNLCYLNRVGNYHHLGYDPAAAPGYPSSPDDDLLPQTLRGLAEAPTAPFFSGTTISSYTCRIGRTSATGSFGDR